VLSVVKEISAVTTPAIRRILVAVKPRYTGLPLAAQHARILAQQLGAELTLFSAVYDTAIAGRVASRLAGAPSARNSAFEAAQSNLERLAESLRDWGVPVRIEVRWQAPAYEAIVEAVKDLGADLLVIGAHEPKPVLHTRLTDTDWQLMRVCPCPLLLVKDPNFQAYGTVLAAVDPLHDHAEPAGTDQSVLKAGELFAKVLGGDLWAVNAYPDPAQYSWVSAVEVLPGVFYGSENIEDVHRQAVQELVERYGVPPERVLLRPGDPRRVVEAAAAEIGANLLVLGALKRGELEQALLGSTAEYLIFSVDCDLLLIKPGWPPR
jgi:universal stress protein E